MSVRNELLQQVLTAYGGTFTGRESRNELLKLIALQIDSSADLPNNRNEILETILELVGGTTDDDNRNALMNATVSTLGGYEAATRNDIISAWVDAAGSVGSRWYWVQNGASYAQIPTVNFTGDFKLSFYYLWKGENFEPLLWGNSYIRLSTAGRVQVYPGGTSSTAVVLQDEVCFIEIERVGGDLSVSVDGVTDVVSTSSSGTLNFTDVLKRTSVADTNEAGTVMYNLEASGVATGSYATGTFNFKMDEEFSDSHEILDSDNGVAGTKYNDVADDYTQTEPSQ